MVSNLCFKTSSDFTEYNVQNYITILEDLTPYNFPFTRIRNVEKNLETAADGEESKTEEVKTEEIKTEEEKKTSAVDDLIEKLK